MYHDFRALDPSKYLDEVSPGRTATVVVAAVDSSLQARAQADFVCDGVNDHIEIQAALNALPATGGEVKLLEGTYNIEAAINLNSNQTLKGCGRNTILTTSTAAITILNAVGGFGTEKIGIVIADLEVDGATIDDYGIVFEYVEYSCIQNVCSRRNTTYGIVLENSDFNIIEGNTCKDNVGGLTGVGIHLRLSDNNTLAGNICKGNDYGIHLRSDCNNNTITGNVCGGNTDGIQLYSSNGNTISGNVCQGNAALGVALYDSSDNNTITGNTCNGNVSRAGIELGPGSNNTITGNTCNGNRRGIYLTAGSINNTISGNTCQGNTEHGIYVYNASNTNTIAGNGCLGNAWSGIYLSGCDDNTVEGNTCQGNDLHGIRLDDCNDNTIIGNTCTENSQHTDNLYDDIFLEGDSDYNNIQGNTCRAGALANQPRYGINVSEGTCNENRVTDNDLRDDGFGTLPFNDAGTGTKLDVYVVPFVDGTDPQDSGFLIDAAGEYARTWLRLPDKVVQVVRMKVYTRRVTGFAVPPMMVDFVIYGAADHTIYTTHDGSLADAQDGTNVNVNNIAYWELTEAGILALKGGDSVEVKALYSGTHLATAAYFRTVEIEYV